MGERAMTDEWEHWHRLLETHIAVLQVLELQIARCGDLAVLPHIVTEIRDRKEKIAVLEARLAAAAHTPMILIPAGAFLMGSDPRRDKDALDDEQPQHTLYLPDYYIAKTPVTNAQYAEFVREAGLVAPRYHWRKREPLPDELEHPVVYVSWHDSMAYCNWLADITGKRYRLPSEAEWEKAARGMDGRIYPWGSRWHPGWCNTSEGGLRGTTPVGRYPRGASPYGLLDVAGNVWELCSSLYREYPYDASDGREDLGASGSRVMRGGSWRGNPRVARCAARNGRLPDSRSDYLGFRVVVSPI